MNFKIKFKSLSTRTKSIGLAVFLIALIAGVYFLFKPFPKGPSLDVSANTLPEQEAALDRSWSATAARYQGLADLFTAIKFAQEEQRNLAPAAPQVSSGIPSDVLNIIGSEHQRNLAPAAPQVSSGIPSDVLNIIGSEHQRDLAPAAPQVSSGIPSDVLNIIGSEHQRNLAPAPSK